MKSKLAVFICFVSVARATGTDSRDPQVALSDVHRTDSTTVIYCQPFPTISVSGGTGEHAGNSRRPVITKNGKGHSGKGQPHDYASEGNENGSAYEKDGKYWLVPPFLIGTSSIVVIYVTVHCLYTHCNCAADKTRHRRRPGPGGPVPIRRVQITTAAGMANGSGGRNPTIVLSDTGIVGKSSTGASGGRLVPLVCYDDVGASSGSVGGGTAGLGAAYGRTQLVEAQPFLIYEQCDDSLDYHEEQPTTPRKGSGFLQLPAAIGRRLSQARLSFSSIGRRESHGRNREPRASICFVPVARAISDPSGVTGDGVSSESICGLGQPHFEAFYCRSCGVHNVVSIGSPICSAISTKRTSNSPPPEADTSHDVHIDQPDMDVPNALSSPTGLAMLLPTIVVDDETLTEQSATESCSDQVDENEKRRDSTVVIVTEEI